MHKLSIRKYSKSKLYFSYAALFILLAAALVLGISIGSVSIPLFHVVQILGAEIFHYPLPKEIDSSTVSIIMQIRFPRVLLAMLVGFALALAGTAFQGLLKNPLADPYTLGVSSGSSLGAVIVLFFGLQLPGIGNFTLPVVSIVAGFLTLVGVISFARLVQRNLSVETIILAGILCSSFLGALISLLIALSGEELRQIIGWLLGSVSMRGWPYVSLIAPFLAAGLLMLLTSARELNAMSFSQSDAKSIGVDVKKHTTIVLLGASLLTGSAVAVSGTVGFVGLVIPHIGRMIWGVDHRQLLPLSMLLGGVFLVLVDLLARTIIAPTELPIGVLTAIIGSPVFAIIFIQHRRKRVTT
ncbi:FecCD family ABC transporter permease [Fictibacillus barbaricus]|uniref:Iron ABC transporter permease n=1 Tax=Fictibacillus barbaricus TaxID=182136 RepID=A0ABS2ZAP1_9BACL|nr:iron ABC transporter permease [Fictibacillus barbaricus]MBN3544965.1 iron ABC transporter permease [Fictibacillus barbaricus]GGB62732.1 putative ABC transporter permease protein YvrB [Fictibacillus barbaricus]